MSKETAEAIAKEVTDWLARPDVYDGIGKQFIFITQNGNKKNGLHSIGNLSCDSVFLTNALLLIIDRLEKENPELLPFFVQYISSSVIEIYKNRNEK